MPPNIADREIKYPVTFTNFYDVAQVLTEYEIAIATDSPSSDTISAARRFRAKA